MGGRAFSRGSGEGGEPLVGLGVVEGAGLEVESGAGEGWGGDAEGAGLFEEVGGGDGAVGEGGGEEMDGVVELGFCEGVVVFGFVGGGRGVGEGVGFPVEGRADAGGGDGEGERGEERAEVVFELGEDSAVGELGIGGEEEDGAGEGGVGE